MTQTPAPRPRPRRHPPTSIPISGGLWPVATAVALIALLGMLIWNINLRGDIDGLEQQLSSMVGENASLRESANATVYQLTPTSNGPANAHAQAWFSVQGSGVLSAANLPVLSGGRTYQLWYMTDSPTTPIPGGTFRVDDTGQGFMLIPSDVGVITSIAITEEPVGGSQAPSGPILLASDVSGARG